MNHSRRSTVEGPLSKEHRSSEARRRRASLLVYIYIYIYIYIYEHEAIQKPKSENNIGAPLAPQKQTAYFYCVFYTQGMGDVYKISESILIQSLDSTYLEVVCCTHIDHVVYTYNHINTYILSYPPFTWPRNRFSAFTWALKPVLKSI